MKQIRDAVVIGSGIIGSATALALTRIGIRRVTLIEKGPLVSGMTRRNAGLAHPFQAHPLLCNLATASFEFYSQWAVVFGGKNGFVETGAAAVVVADENPSQTTGKFDMWKEHAGNLTNVNGRTLADVFPGATANLKAALFTPHAGYADAVLTAQAMVNAASERGLEVKTGTQVKQILVENGNAKGVRTTTGDIEAPAIVVTAGSWSERLVGSLGLILHLRFRRGALAFYEQPREMSHELPMFLDAAGQYFLRPHPYHMAACGSIEREATVQGVEGLDERVSLVETVALNDFMARCVPGLANAPPKRAHSIVYDTPGDGLPVLGAVPGVAGLFIGAGFGTSAFAVAPAAGEILAQMLVDGQSGRDVSQFGPMRQGLRNP